MVKNLPANTGDAGLIPGSGRSPGGGNGGSVQYSCLENPMDIEAQWLQSMELQRVRHDLATRQQQSLRKELGNRNYINGGVAEDSILCILNKLNLV